MEKTEIEKAEIAEEFLEGREEKKEYGKLINEELKKRRNNEEELIQFIQSGDVLYKIHNGINYRGLQVYFFKNLKYTTEVDTEKREIRIDDHISGLPELKQVLVELEWQTAEQIDKVYAKKFDKIWEEINNEHN
jgi:hypothetical protein